MSRSESLGGTLGTRPRRGWISIELLLVLVVQVSAGLLLVTPADKVPDSSLAQGGFSHDWTKCGQRRLSVIKLRPLLEELAANVASLTFCSPQAFRKYSTTQASTQRVTDGCRLRSIFLFFIFL